MRNRKIFIALILVFLSGIIIGGFIGYYSGRRKYSRRSVKQHMVERLARRLELNAEQQKAVALKIDQNIKQLQMLRDKHLPELIDEINRSYDSIKPLLTDEQKEKLEKLRLEMLERFMKKMKSETPAPENQQLKSAP